MRVVKSFAYYGGKSYLAPTLLKLLPRHTVYVEVFGGSGALLFAKPPSDLEVFNDVDSGVVGFFRVLRDEAKARQLQQQLELTPYAREEYDECWATWQACVDDVERARRWYVSVFMAFSARTATKAGWAHTIVPHAARAKTLRATTALFPQFHSRFANVLIERDDFARVLAAYDSPDTLFYLDPPYVASSRRSANEYAHEMTDGDHVRLLDALAAIQGMAILSGYAHPLYDGRLAAMGWERLTKQAIAWSAGRTKASGLQGKANVLRKGQTREEVIWLNPACVRRQASLFNMTDGLEMEAQG